MSAQPQHYATREDFLCALSTTKAEYRRRANEARAAMREALSEADRVRRETGAILEELLSKIDANEELTDSGSDEEAELQDMRQLALDAMRALEYQQALHAADAQPKELAAAMSFPKNYRFAGTKTDVVRQIGNAVPVETSRAHSAAMIKEITR